MSKKTKIVFVVSLVLNGLTALLFVGSYVANMFISDYYIYQVNRNWACESNYQNMIDRIERDWSHDPEGGEAAKKVYAIEACLRNYKTGEQLKGIEALEAEVDATP